MLPTARPGLPPRAASIPTASSGTLVPSDTTVRPIIIGRMPSHDARPVPARTSTSAPMISATSPPRISNRSSAPPPARYRSAFPGREDRTRRVAYDVIRHRTEHRPPDPTTPPGTEHDHRGRQFGRQVADTWTGWAAGDDDDLGVGELQGGARPFEHGVRLGLAVLLHLVEVVRR